jgi:hypothetical protein
MMKQCSRCKELQPVENFGRDKSRADGVSMYCRERSNSQPRPTRESKRLGEAKTGKRAGAAVPTVR